ncbi:hypothetical protein Mycsm_07024 (plasmid) [Mycobacterium sp. JS623]|uniref:hypothetical protein n=1 Tax=Mycobacterium sp. JS623 TaxID=212767 RepID=UPI0002A57EC5|nr:hypothetical protein [Mycobacterium sp. JS623]AGB27124.1 hypothetical protein Mycsm_07024 [Mycobacterium sp. JS623]
MTRLKNSPTISAVLTAIAVVFASPAAAAPPLPPSPAITPGVGLVVSNADDTGGDTCTGGWLAHDASGQPVMFTAGHCDMGGRVSMKWTISGAYETIGSFTRSVNEGKGAEDSDIALIALDNGAIPGDSRVLDRRPVEGATTDVKVGDVLCKYGNATQRQCGPVVAAPTASKVQFAAHGEPGDSGGPVYLIQPDGDAVAVGITLGRNASGEEVAELVQPWLQKWQLTLDTSKPVVGAQPVGYGK